MYNANIMKHARKLHKMSAVADAWDLTFEEIAKAYFEKGHEDWYFIEMMEQRAIYYDLADMDNMSIMQNHYPEKYQEWLEHQPPEFFG